MPNIASFAPEPLCAERLDLSPFYEGEFLDAKVQDAVQTEAGDVFVRSLAIIYPYLDQVDDMNRTRSSWILEHQSKRYLFLYDKDINQFDRHTHYNTPRFHLNFTAYTIDGEEIGDIVFSCCIAAFTFLRAANDAASVFRLRNEPPKNDLLDLVNALALTIEERKTKSPTKQFASHFIEYGLDLRPKTTNTYSFGIHGSLKIARPSAFPKDFDGEDGVFFFLELRLDLVVDEQIHHKKKRPQTLVDQALVFQPVWDHRLGHANRFLIGPN